MDGFEYALFRGAEPGEGGGKYFQVLVFLSAVADAEEKAFGVRKVVAGDGIDDFLDVGLVQVYCFAVVNPSGRILDLTS